MTKAKRPHDHTAARGVTRRPFYDAPDLGEIRYRLHPIDVGFDLRAARAAVYMIDAEDPLSVSCADQAGDRIVLSGSRAAVIAELRCLGYEVEV